MLDAIDLTGHDYLRVVTELLLAARGDDPMAGLYEAGDLQWWWKDEDALASSRHTFWLDEARRPLASLIVSEQGPGQRQAGRFDCDLLWRPAADAVVRAEVFPVALERLAALPAGPGRTVAIVVDERDADWRGRLEAVGFRHESGEDEVQMWQRSAAPPPPRPLPAGMRFDDERSRPADRLHHLVARNGERVAARLREGSLYRPELDLCVRLETGEVAAYCVCWLDPTNGVGLFEPVRTEDAYQRRGIEGAADGRGAKDDGGGGGVDQGLAPAGERGGAGAVRERRLRGRFRQTPIPTVAPAAGRGRPSRRSRPFRFRLSPCRSGYAPFSIGTPTMLPYSVQLPS